MKTLKLVIFVVPESAKVTADQAAPVGVSMVFRPTPEKLGATLALLGKVAIEQMRAQLAAGTLVVDLAEPVDPA